MRYRQHKGSLADSIATTVEVDGRAGLMRRMREELDAWQYNFDETCVKIRPYVAHDAFSGWKDVHIVTIDGYGVMGFIEGPADV